MAIDAWPHIWPSVALPNNAAVCQIQSQQRGYPLAQLSADCAARADQELLHSVCAQRNPARVVVGIAWARLIERPLAKRARHHADETAAGVKYRASGFTLLRAHLQDQSIWIPAASIPRNGHGGKDLQQATSAQSGKPEFGWKMAQLPGTAPAAAGYAG